MAHSDDTRRSVRAAFVFDAQTLEIAALRYGVPLPTASRWKREAKTAGDDWDRARGAQMIAGGGIEDVVRQTLGVIVQQTQITVHEIQANTEIGAAEKVKMLASLGDSYHKLMASSKRLMPETDKLAVAMDVIKRFGDYVTKVRPALAGEFVELMEPFGEELARTYG